MNLYDEILIKLKSTIYEKGFTLDEFSKISGINRQTLNCYFAKEQKIRLKTFLKFCDLLNVMPSYIMGYCNRDENDKK